MPGPRSRWTDEQFVGIAADDPGGELYAATAALASLTDPDPSPTRIVRESDVLGGLGVVAGSTLLDAIEAAVPPRVSRLIRDQGIDMQHPETIAMLDSLVTASAIDKDQRDALLVLGERRVPRWPGIRAADVELARTEYAGA